jgi:hypothetical protein
MNLLRQLAAWIRWLWVSGERCPYRRSRAYDPKRSTYWEILFPTVYRWRCENCGSSWETGRAAYDRAESDFRRAVKDFWCAMRER